MFAAEHSESTIPEDEGAASPSCIKSRSARVRAICCSAMKRIDIRLRIAPSKKLEMSVWFMYFAASWKLKHFIVQSSVV